jgi:hypothetical protein
VLQSGPITNDACFLAITPNHINEHQFAEPGQHAFAAGAFIGEFGNSKMDEKTANEPVTAAMFSAQSGGLENHA